MQKDLGTPELAKRKLIYLNTPALDPSEFRIDKFLAAGIIDDDHHRAGMKLTRWHRSWAMKYNVKISNYNSDHVRGSAEDARIDMLTNSDLYSKTMNEMTRNHRGMGTIVLSVIVDNICLNDAAASLKCRKDTAKKKIRMAFDALCESIDYVLDEGTNKTG